MDVFFSLYDAFYRYADRVVRVFAITVRKYRETNTHLSERERFSNILYARSDPFERLRR